MEGKTYSQTRAALLTSVSRFSVPVQDDYGDIRFEIARRLLRRVPPQQPVVMRHPWSGQVVFVESEPDDWREFLEAAMREGTLGQVMNAARVEGRAH